MTTRNLVPRATGEGSLGTAAKKWGNIYADNITLQDGETLATKISSQNSRITTAEGTVTTLSSDVTSLYSSVDELSSGKVNKANPVDNNGYAMETVVASGTNYIRYASGLQICWGQVEYTSVVNVDNSFTVTFPIDFTGGGIPRFIVTVNGEWCTRICCGAISVNKTKAVVYALRSGGTNSIQNYCHWVAIGRWK